MPTPDNTKLRYVQVFDENLNPITPINPLPVTMVAPPTLPSNVRVIDRFNADFIDLLVSLWDGAPLTKAQWDELFDSDSSTFRALNANVLILFKTAQQVDEIEFISGVMDVPGTFVVFTPAGDALTFGPGATKATPKAKVLAFTFIPDVVPVNIAEIIIKSFTHTAIFPETDYAGKDNTLYPSGAMGGFGFFPTMPKARIVGICKFRDGLGTGAGRLRIIQSFDGINDDYITQFPVNDEQVGNPNPGGLGFSVEVIAPYARVEVENSGATPWTMHQTFAYTRGAP